MSEASRAREKARFVAMHGALPPAGMPIWAWRQSLFHVNRWNFRAVTRGQSVMAKADGTREFVTPKERRSRLAMAALAIFNLVARPLRWLTRRREAAGA